MSVARHAGAILLALAIPTFPDGVAPANAQGAGIARPSGGELVRALRQGGYVIYLRHTASDQTTVDTDRTNLDQCETQRNLSEEGRRQAREIGKAFKELGIPVGKVLSSRFCRAVDTAQLAFGRYDKSDTLYYAVGAAPELRVRRNAELRRLLATPPEPGTNTVLVSHHANLKAAAGIWPKHEGTAQLFRPDPALEFQHVAEVSAEEWSQWARLFAPGR